jgi:hypothetical protein
MNVKNDILSHNQDFEMLQLGTYINMTYGLNYHFVYFCLKTFFIQV